MRISLWAAFLVRWALTLLLLLLIAIDLGWVLPALLFLMTVAIEIIVHQIAGLRRDLRALRLERQNLGVGTGFAREMAAAVHSSERSPEARP